MAIEELKALVPEQKNDTITPNAFLQIALAVVVEKHRTTAAHGEYQQRRNGGARGTLTKARKCCAIVTVFFWGE